MTISTSASFAHDCHHHVLPPSILPHLVGRDASTLASQQRVVLLQHSGFSIVSELHLFFLPTLVLLLLPFCQPLSTDLVFLGPLQDRVDVVHEERTTETNWIHTGTLRRTSLTRFAGVATADLRFDGQRGILGQLEYSFPMPRLAASSTQQWLQGF